MSPTIWRIRGYRFFFYSREESRPHIHVVSADGSAKFWLEPNVELADSHGYNGKTLGIVEKEVLTHAEEFRRAWRSYFTDQDR